MPRLLVLFMKTPKLDQGKALGISLGLGLRVESQGIVIISDYLGLYEL